MRNTASGKHTLPQYSATHFSTESISHYTQYAQPPPRPGTPLYWFALSQPGSAPALRLALRSAQPARSEVMEPGPSDRYAGRTPTPSPQRAGLQKGPCTPPKGRVEHRAEDFSAGTRDLPQRHF